MVSSTFPATAIIDVQARATLRRVHPDDASGLIEANIESRTHHQPWARPFTDRPGFDAWFTRISTPSDVALVARDPASDGIIGVVHFSQVVLGDFHSAYLGFYGMIGFAGRGLMTDCVRRAIGHAFDELDLHRIEANIQPRNTRSIDLVRRAGLRKEGFSPRYLRIDGIWRDHERWAVLADDDAV